MENRIVLPVALQIVTDDIGWFNGRDIRCSDGPSRTGMPRRHCAEDYAMLNAIGKSIGQRINAPLVIGEWDKKNRLRGMPHASYNEAGWDMASEIDYAEAERCFDVMEKAEYLEYGFHGLLHGYWQDGISLADQEFSYPRSLDYKTKYAPASWLVPVDNAYLESHVETFFEIYNDWGFKKKIRSFTSPSSVQGGIEENRHMTATMKKYGMIYWSNQWRAVKNLCEVIDGVIFVNKAIKQQPIPWEAYGVDPDTLCDYSFAFNNGIEHAERAIYGSHWPNFLQLNPLRNTDTLDAWTRHFKKQAEIFGVMLSKDIAFCASQAVYRKRSVLEYRKDGLVIDLAAVDGAGALGLSDTFHISIENGLKPVCTKGASLSLYETRENFTTYALKRTGEPFVALTLK
ncbi:MAG: hypothetical protein J6J66_07410 [Clostridia bacterium]|nr:hypothetical protein [Clostridia bacterium]